MTTIFEDVRVQSKKLRTNYMLACLFLLLCIWLICYDALSYLPIEKYNVLLIFLFFFCLICYLIYLFMKLYFNFYITNQAKKYLWEYWIVAEEKINFQSMKDLKKNISFNRNIHRNYFEKNFFWFYTDWVSIKTREVIHVVWLINYVPTGFGHWYIYWRRITDHYLLWEVKNNQWKIDWTQIQDKLNNLLSNKFEQCVVNDVLYIKQKLAWFLFSWEWFFSSSHFEKTINLFIKDFENIAGAL